MKRSCKRTKLGVSRSSTTTRHLLEFEWGRKQKLNSGCLSLVASQRRSLERRKQTKPRKNQMEGLNGREDGLSGSLLLELWRFGWREENREWRGSQTLKEVRHSRCKKMGGADPDPSTQWEREIEGKPPAFKLCSEIEQTTDLGGVMEERILDSHEEFALENILSIA